MSTKDTGGNESSARQMVERKFDLHWYVEYDYDEMLDKFESDAPETRPDTDPDEQAHRAIARTVYDTLGQSSDYQNALATSESTNTNRLIEVGDTGAVEFGPHDDNYEDLMRLCASYGGQHPFKFTTEEETDLKWRNGAEYCAARAFSKVFNDDSTPQQLALPPETTLGKVNTTEWRTTDGNTSAQVSTSNYSSVSISTSDSTVTMRLTASIDLEAPDSDTIEALDSVVVDKVDALVQDALSGLGLSEVEAGTRETEICEVTE